MIFVTKRKNIEIEHFWVFYGKWETKTKLLIILNTRQSKNIKVKRKVFMKELFLRVVLFYNMLVLM